MRQVEVFLFALILSQLALLTAGASYQVSVYNATTGQLDNGFQNWSWAQVNLQNTNPVYPGSRYSISMIVNNYEALYINGPFIFHPSDIQNLNFRINGGPQGNQQINIILIRNSTQLGQSLPVSRYIPGGNIPANQWATINIPFSDFQVSNSTQQLIYGIQFQAAQSNSMGSVYFDSISFFAYPAGPAPVSINVSRSISIPVSKDIFGVNFANSSHFSNVPYPVNRWGGDATTRYAWQLDAQNSANDWYFENNGNPVDVNKLPNSTSSDVFIQSSLTAKSKVLLTVGTIGWSPRDRVKRCGFSTQKYGQQQQSDPYFPECGNGVNLSGQDITGNNPYDTSVQVGPDYVMQWLQHIEQVFGSGAVTHFQLDNEPGLWHTMHRDVHPIPLGYDDYITYTTAYSNAIKAKYPSAIIHGPISWGWCEIEYSPKDGCADGSDRKAHGDLPLVKYYLSQVSEMLSNRGGTPLIDVLDVHFYPQQTAVSFGTNTFITDLLRFRSVLSLYDQFYIDESWIGKPIYLLPRLQSYIDSYPNIKKLVTLAVSEYNFGADNLITAALVQLDVFGIFAAQNVQIANRWIVPEPGSQVENAFKMILNYDGQGSSILPSNLISAVSNNTEQVTTYAYQGPNHLYVIIVCRQSQGSVPVSVNIEGAGSGKASAYQFSQGKPLSQIESVALRSGSFSFVAPAYSATLFVL